MLDAPKDPNDMYANGVSADIIDLVQKLLRVNPLERLSATDALQHRCFMEHFAPIYPTIVITMRHDVARYRVDVSNSDNIQST